MLTKIWNAVKAPFVWLKKLWDKFEAWVASWAPGAKTKLVSFLGLLGSIAYAGKDYIAGVGLDKFVTATQYSIIVAVLFTLAFWFRGIGERVAARG